MKSVVPADRAEARSGLVLSRRHVVRGVIAIGAIIALSGVISQAAPTASGSTPAILSFQTMVGDSGPYVGSANPIRGISAGPAPWSITSGVGQLLTNGSLHIVVKGLVVTGGGNPVPKFKAIVSCQSINSTGGAAVTNVSTGTFPATTTGDSTISATVTLPHPCFAPIIFVTSPTSQWFAVTGAS